MRDFFASLVGLWGLAFVGAACLLLNACGQPEPIRIPVPCVEQEQIPPEVPPVGRLPDDARQAADILGVTVLGLRANERIMRGLLRGCSR
jgi:hypothetical protein